MSIACISLSFMLSFGGAMDRIDTLLKTDPDRARDVLTAACDDPEYKIRAHYLLCLLANREGDAATALIHGKQLVNLQPEKSEAHLQYAIAMRNRFYQSKWYAITHVDEYKRHLAKALRFDKHNYPAWHEKITFLMYAPAIAGGSSKKARAALEELEQLDAEQALFVSAMIQAREQQHAKALANFERVIKNNRGNTSAQFGAAFSLLGLERYRESADRFQAIYDQDAGQLSALFQANRARVLGSFELKAAIQALDTYANRCKNNPTKRAEALYFKGKAQTDLGHKTEAKNTLRRCLEIDPSLKKAKKLLASLK